MEANYPSHVLYEWIRCIDKSNCCQPFQKNLTLWERMSPKTASNHKDVAHAWKIDFLIFRLEIPHDELINVVCLFCSDLLFFPRNFAKIARDANRYKMVDISAPSIKTRTSLLKSAKASLLFFFLYICVRGIGKLFRPKTRIFHHILNLRCMFKNHQYFGFKI